MNTKLTFGRLALAASVSVALFACASATDVSPSEEGENAGARSDEALSIGPVVGSSSGSGTISGSSSGGGTTSTNLPAVPHVVARSASGSMLTVTFDRPVTPAELPMAAATVQVVRRTASGPVKLNVMSSASLTLDGKIMMLNLAEPLRVGDVYYARGTWHRCVTLVGITSCKDFRADFGEFAQLAPTTRPVRGFAGTEPAAPLNVALFSSPAPALLPGSFQVLSTSPADGTTGVARESGLVVVTFTGGHLDCTRTSHGKDGFELSSQSPDVNAQQEMYEDPAAPHPTDWLYKGSLVCDETANTLSFTPPGYLYGDVWYHVNVTATSKEGDTISATRQFRTARPGIIITASRVENDYGADNTCDSNGLFGGKNYCDVYVTSAIATDSVTSQTSRIPLAGDYDEMRYFPADNANGQRAVSPAQVLFSTSTAIGETVDLQLWAHDADSDSEWKTVLTDAGKIGVIAGTALTAASPQYGAITTAVGNGLQGLAALIPTNDDDAMGSAHVYFTLDANRWQTTATVPFSVPLSLGIPSRGPVWVDLETAENPRSWQPNQMLF